MRPAKYVRSLIFLFPSPSLTVLRPSDADRSWPPREQETVASETDRVTAISSKTTDKTAPEPNATEVPHFDASPTTSTGALVIADAVPENNFVDYGRTTFSAVSPAEEPAWLPLPMPDYATGADASAWQPMTDAISPMTDDTAIDAPEKPVRFSDEAMRVLETCEQALLKESDGSAEAARALKEIAVLKRRYRPAEPSRCSIARHRRYTLGSEARRVLKKWVDMHIEDPYPSVTEKEDLAFSAGLSLKQVNDWFTNYRKRHWEEEMQGARRLSI